MIDLYIPTDSFHDVKLVTQHSYPYRKSLCDEANDNVHTVQLLNVENLTSGK